MKTLSLSALAGFVALLLSCGTAKNGKVAMHDEPEPKYAIGDTAHGGIVFIVNAEGTHGIVAALQDQLENSHYQDSYDLINDPRFHDQDGKQYFDWRLPKLWEAYKMYMNLHLVNQGNFSGSGYWTLESGISFDQKHVLNFSKGVDHMADKGDTYRARGVRVF